MHVELLLVSLLYYMFMLTLPVYVAVQQSSCYYSKKNVGATMSSFISVRSGVETHLQRALAYVGPVSVAVDANNKAFRVG